MTAAALQDEPLGWQRRSGVPAWLLSLAMHFTALVTLGFVTSSVPQGAAEEASRSGGIVLVQRNAGSAEYFSLEDGSDSAAASANVIQATADPLPDSHQPPPTDGPQLPTGGGANAAAQPPTAGLPNATDLAQGRETKGGPLGPGGKFDVQTQVFGVPGRGSAFVYVFDRSSSMGGHQGAPLLAAKDELVKSLASLQSVHQFQIIFYNEKPELMHLFRGQPATMVFADDRSKQLAARFIGGIQADGSTKHLEALTMALQMRPDVIFFLTDADMPELTRDELDRIRRLNRGTVINAIEFGSASAARSHNFLKQLAAENGGQHGYVDVTKLAR